MRRRRRRTSVRCAEDDVLVHIRSIEDSDYTVCEWANMEAFYNVSTMRNTRATPTCLECVGSADEERSDDER